MCLASTKKCVPYLGCHKSRITNLKLRHTNKNEIWECSNLLYTALVLIFDTVLLFPPNTWTNLLGLLSFLVNKFPHMFYKYSSFPLVKEIIYGQTHVLPRNVFFVYSTSFPLLKYSPIFAVNLPAMFAWYDLILCNMSSGCLVWCFTSTKLKTIFNHVPHSNPEFSATSHTKYCE